MSPTTAPRRRRSSVPGPLRRLLPLVALLAAACALPARAEHPAQRPEPFVPSARSLHASFHTDNWKFNHIVAEAFPEILERELPSGALIESGPESNLYPHIFPRAMWPMLLARCGYLDAVHDYLAFMYDHRQKDGSFANFYRTSDGKGMGVREEDGGSYVVWATAAYLRFGGDEAFVRDHWQDVRKAMRFLEKSQDRDTGLLGSTAGTMETPEFEQGFNIYHQLISIAGFRAAARIADGLGEPGDAAHWRELEGTIRQGIVDHLTTPDGTRFVYKTVDDGNQFWAAYFLFTYWDVWNPHDPVLTATIDRVMADQVAEDGRMLALEPFSMTTPTGNGPWLGQWGHGMIICHFLRTGDLAEAGRWLDSFVDLIDTRTFLVPEHINWARWDADGGRPDYPGYGLYPDESAWVDPGNLFTEGTAMMMLPTMVELDPDDAAANLWVRLPVGLDRMEADNLLGPQGYVSVRARRDGGSWSVDLSGGGAVRLHLVGTPWSETTALREAPEGTTLHADDNGDVLVDVPLPGRTFLDLQPVTVRVE